MSTYRPHPLDRGIPPEWASSWGEDRYGVFAGFHVGEAEQRMRWIEPGTFRMGSPEEEAGRFDREVFHEVTLTEGFWLADTPCTQELWEAVMGENPSRFQSKNRPVEQVRWEDCQRFCEKLGWEKSDGQVWRLPTEAEWEYACRAGAKDATYAGPMVIEGERNAPSLDAIAWYGGNSGEGFDLADGYDSSDWPEKQYDHERAGTRKVKTRAPNPWGLYDTLGNVHEWCWDWWDAYDLKNRVNPEGPAEGQYRVIRGGSWFSGARYVRAAYRDFDRPSYRNGDLGFRLARGQGLLSSQGARSARQG